MGSKNAERYLRQDDGEWRRLIDAQEGSGVSIDEFCRTQGISATNFYRRRSLLREDGGVGAAKLAGQFVDVGTVSVFENSPASFELHVALGKMLSLRLVRR